MRYRMAVSKSIILLSLLGFCLGLDSWRFRDRYEDGDDRDYSSYLENKRNERRTMKDRQDFLNYYQSRQGARRIFDEIRDRYIKRKRDARRRFMNYKRKATSDSSVYCNEVSRFAPDMCENEKAKMLCPSICGSDKKNADLLNCGKRKEQNKNIAKRVIGGHASKEGEWPWVVSLHGTMIKDVEGYHLVCAGTILSEHFVLTAMNCFNPEYVNNDGEWTVTAGQLNINEKTGQTVKVKNKFYSPTFRGVKYNIPGKLFAVFSGDITLLQLEAPLKMTENVKPLCLPRDNKIANDDCSIAGWGYTEYFNGLKGLTSNTLQSAKIPVVTNTECNAKNVYDGKIPEREVLCAGYKDGGKDGCNYDSGTALACKGDDDLWYERGIMSQGYKCAEPNAYGLYTRVSSHKKWIIDTILDAGNKREVVNGGK